MLWPLDHGKPNTPMGRLQSAQIKDKPTSEVSSLLSGSSHEKSESISGGSRQGVSVPDRTPKYLGTGRTY